MVLTSLSTNWRHARRGRRYRSPEKTDAGTRENLSEIHSRDEARRVSIKRSIRNKACRHEDRRVTGAARASAEPSRSKLAREGFRVIAIARDAAALASLARGPKASPRSRPTWPRRGRGQVADHHTAREIERAGGTTPASRCRPHSQDLRRRLRARHGITSRRRSC